MMAGIRGKNTRPELRIRKALFARGLRYRLHSSVLPGKPDIVFPKYHAVIFVNGCFWHGHDCHLFKLPDTRREFWKNKIGRTRERDREILDRIQQSGWRTLTVWECAIRGRSALDFGTVIDRANAWVRSGEASMEIRGTV